MPVRSICADAGSGRERRQEHDRETAVSHGGPFIHPRQCKYRLSETLMRAARRATDRALSNVTRAMAGRLCDPARTPITSESRTSDNRERTVSRLSPRTERLILLGVALCWLMAVAVGLSRVWIYADTPGRAADAPPAWPASSSPGPGSGQADPGHAAAPAVHLLAGQPRRAGQADGPCSRASHRPRPVLPSDRRRSRLGAEAGSAPTPKPFPA